MHPLILSPRALHYRTDCTRRSKFLTHALIRCLQPIFTTQLQRKRKVLWAQRATKRSTISNLVKISLQNVANIISNSPTFHFTIFITFCSLPIVPSTYITLTLLLLTCTVSFFKCPLRVLWTFPLFFNDVEQFHKNLQGAICDFKFKFESFTRFSRK